MKTSGPSHLLRLAAREGGFDSAKLLAGVANAKAGSQLNPLDVAAELRALARNPTSERDYFSRELDDDERVALLALADRIDGLATRDDFVPERAPVAETPTNAPAPARVKPAPPHPMPAAPGLERAQVFAGETVLDSAREVPKPGHIPRTKLLKMAALLKSAPLDAVQMASDYSKNGIAEVPTGFLADAALDVLGKTKWLKAWGSPTGLAFITSREAATAFLKDRDIERVEPITKALIGPSLISVGGERHHALRQAMLPLFADGEIDAMSASIAKTSKDLATSWAAKAKAGASIDLYADMRTYALDQVTRSAFNVTLTDPEKAEFFESVDAVFFNMFNHAALPSWVPSKSRKDFDEGHDTLQALADSLLDQARLPENSGKMGMLSKLLETKVASDDGILRSLTDEELRAQVLVIALGGEAIASTLTSALVDLGKDPKRQAQVSAELKAHYRPGDPALLNGDALPQTRGSWSESLKAHPSVSVSLRQATKDLELNGCPFQKGTLFVMSPEVAEGNTNGKPAVGKTQEEFGLAFGAFRHKCLGMPLARAIVDRTLADVFSTVKATLPPGEPLEERKDGLVLRPLERIDLRLELLA